MFIIMGGGGVEATKFNLIIWIIAHLIMMQNTTRCKPYTNKADHLRS